jgi:HAD superfamily hydrolase (TIGR01450 family)
MHNSLMDALPETTLEQTIDRYDALLLDAYGVLVHASGSLPRAAEAIHLLNRRRTTYFVVTNDASKLPETAAARYRSFGLPLTADRLITSGGLLASYFADHQLAGARCAVLGPRDSVRYVELAGGAIVPAADDFDVLIVADEAGFPLLETADAALTSVIRAVDAERAIRLLLPNPDFFYPQGGGGTGFAAGSVAAMFEAALAARYPHRDDLRFVRLGKPHPAMFAEARRRAGGGRMVMIGDQLGTDVAGARRFGIDAVLLTASLNAAALAAVEPALRPTSWMRSL